VPVLLNTSFNHSVEPIVQSIDDAVTCFLTTGLTHLVVDDYLVDRREGLRDRLWTLAPTLPQYVRIVQIRQPGRDGCEDVWRCEHVVTRTRTKKLRESTGRLLLHVDGRRSLAAIADELQLSADRDAIIAEIEALWAERLIQLLPVADGRQGDVAARRRHPAGIPADPALPLLPGVLRMPRT
jgi:carbamoyltransferase